MNRAFVRPLRLAVILPPLLFASAYGYMRFVQSPAFLNLIEKLLSTALAADVKIGAHELASRSRIVLHDLEAEFLIDGRASGAFFGAEEAVAEAGWLLGVGPFEQVTLANVKTRLDGPVSTLASLDILARPGGTAAVNRVVLEGITFSFVSNDREYHVGGMVWTFDLGGERVALNTDLPVLKIDGLHSPGLEEEAPSISFRVEIEGPDVMVRELMVTGASGWRVEGELAVDISGDEPVVEGELVLFNLLVKRIYKPPPGVNIPPLATARRNIQLSGPINDLRIQADTAIRGMSYHDTRLGINADGSAGDLTSIIRIDLREAVREYLSRFQQ